MNEFEISIYISQNWTYLRDKTKNRGSLIFLKAW